MKEICSDFKVVLLSDVESVDQQSITLLSDKDYDEFTSDALDLNIDSDSSDAGTVWNVDQDIIIDKVTDEVYNKYRIQRSVILIVFYTDDTYTIYGSFEYPVMLTLTRGLQKDTLSITYTSTERPVI